MRKILLSTLFVAALTSQALAGSTTLSKGGKKIALWCDNGGCYIADKISFFKKGPPKRIGKGGATNFKALKKSMKDKGWR